jgi:hypothetical protein
MEFGAGTNISQSHLGKYICWVTPTTLQKFFKPFEFVYSSTKKVSNEQRNANVSKN